MKKLFIILFSCLFIFISGAIAQKTKATWAELEEAEDNNRVVLVRTSQTEFSVVWLDKDRKILKVIGFQFKIPPESQDNLIPLSY